MDKKRLEYYKKKLQRAARNCCAASRAPQQEGREADEDPTVDLADKAANSYTKEFLFGQTHNDRSLLQLVDDALARIRERLVRRVHFLPRGTAAEAARSRALDALLHHLPGKEGKGPALGPCLSIPFAASFPLGLFPRRADLE